MAKKVHVQAMVGRSKRNGAPDGDAPVKTKNIPSNAHSLIKQMTEFDLEELLLRKMGQGTPVTENDLLHQLELKEKRHKNPMAGAAVAEEDSASEAKKPSTSAPVLEKMSASKVEELDVDFALFDKDGMLFLWHSTHEISPLPTFASTLRPRYARALQETVRSPWTSLLPS